MTNRHRRHATGPDVRVPVRHRGASRVSGEAKSRAWPYRRHQSARRLQLVAPAHHV